MPHRRFLAWHHCHLLAVAVFRSTGASAGSAPEIVGPLRRSAFAAAASLIRSTARREPEALQLALASTLSALAEVAYALLLARELGILTHGQWVTLDRMRERAGREAWRLHRELNRAVEGSRLN